MATYGVSSKLLNGHIEKINYTVHKKRQDSHF
jgi:hypothetical protein